MFGLGFSVAFIMVPAQTLMQQETPAHMLGRVSGSFMSIITVAQVSGLVLSGSVAQGLGVRNLFYASAALLAIIALFGYRRLRARIPTSDS